MISACNSKQSKAQVTTCAKLEAVTVTPALHHTEQAVHAGEGQNAAEHLQDAL